MSNIQLVTNPYWLTNKISLISISSFLTTTATALFKAVTVRTFATASWLISLYLARLCVLDWSSEPRPKSFKNKPFRMKLKVLRVTCRVPPSACFHLLAHLTRLSLFHELQTWPTLWRFQIFQVTIKLFYCWICCSLNLQIFPFLLTAKYFHSSFHKYLVWEAIFFYTQGCKGHPQTNLIVFLKNYNY